MPRKTSVHALAVAANRRFNEAAARCRGKLGDDGQQEPRVPLASMRPRPDAAENSRVALSPAAARWPLQ